MIRQQHCPTCTFLYKGVGKGGPWLSPPSPYFSRLRAGTKPPPHPALFTPHTVTVQNVCTGSSITGYARPQEGFSSSAHLVRNKTKVICTTFASPHPHPLHTLTARTRHNICPGPSTTRKCEETQGKKPCLTVNEAYLCLRPLLHGNTHVFQRQPVLALIIFCWAEGEQSAGGDWICWVQCTLTPICCGQGHPISSVPPEQLHLHHKNWQPNGHLMFCLNSGLVDCSSKSCGTLNYSPFMCPLSPPPPLQKHDTSQAKRQANRLLC